MSSSVVPWGPTTADKYLHEDHTVSLQQLFSRVQFWGAASGETVDDEDEDDEDDEEIDSADEDEAALMDKLDDMAIARDFQDVGDNLESSGSFTRSTTRPRKKGKRS